MRAIRAALAVLVLAVGPAPALGQAGAVAPARIVHLLDYLAADYPGTVRAGAVADAEEYGEQVEFAGHARGLIERLPAHPQKDALLREAARLQALIGDKAPGEAVAAAATGLRAGLILAYRIETAPRRLPDLVAAAGLYRAHCATCHGAAGRGDGPAGAALKPPPADLTARDRQEGRSAFSVFNTITFGVTGTGMAAFTTLTEDERWALAFYASGLADTDAERAEGRALWQRGTERALVPDLARLASLSPAEARRQGGERGARILAYLRREPGALPAAPDAPLQLARARLAESVRAYRAGQPREAESLALSAYLDGVEPIEARLQARDRQIKTTIEAEMARYRAALRAGASVEAVTEQAARLEARLAEAEARLAEGIVGSVPIALSAATILVREGLEALLVVAAMLAFVRRAGRREAARAIHLGWLAALALGVVTWVAATRALTFTGAHREVTEGATALLAAGVLAFVGVWMHGQSRADRWQLYVEQRVRGALAGGTRWALWSVAFLAVYREVVETILFYQSLWVDTAAAGRGALLGGVAAGAALLAVLGWVLIRTSARLPLRQFFAVAALTVAVLAVVFVGRGVAALQEAGVLPISPLGVYGTVQTLGAQLALVAAMLAWTLCARGRRPATRA